jgi:ABC-type nitrate/sulfonate/bicarbonate transport system permease component
MSGDSSLPPRQGKVGVGGASIRLPLPQLATAAGAVVLWELIARGLRPPWLPPVEAVAAAWWRLASSGQLGELSVTGLTLIVGLAVVFLAGAALTAAVSLSPLLEQALDPLLNAALAVPTIALVPVFILLWGLSDVTRVATVVSFALVPMVVTWSSGVRQAPAHLFEMARAFDAGAARRLLSVFLPAVAPVLLAGARIAVVQGIKGVVSAEILIGVVGIGKLLQTATVTFDLASLYAQILMLLVLSVAVYLGLETLERYATRRSHAE